MFPRFRLLLAGLVVAYALSGTGALATPAPPVIVRPTAEAPAHRLAGDRLPVHIGNLGDHLGRVLTLRLAGTAASVRFVAGLSGKTDELLEIPLDTKQGEYGLEIVSEGGVVLTESGRAVTVGGAVDGLTVTGPNGRGSVVDGERVGFAGRIGVAAVVVDATLVYYYGGEQVDFDHVPITWDEQGNLTGQFEVRPLQKTDQVRLRLELADRTGVQRTVESNLLPVLAGRQAEPVLLGEAHWGRTLEWHALAEPGSRLIYAFLVQRDAGGDMSGPQFDVRGQTTLDESGVLHGNVRVDFLHALAADIYFWAEYRLKDGSHIRGASKVLPVAHRQQRVDFVVAEAARWENGIREPLDMAPMLDESRVFVAVRHATEPFGASLSWNQQTQVATLRRGETTLVLQVGSPEAVVNGVRRLIDPANRNVVPQNIAGRVMIPLRFVAETLGVNVEWVGRERRVVIQSPQ